MSFAEQLVGPPAISNPRPIGVAEPLRRSSGSLIVRTSKTGIAGESEKNTDKSVQVNTIIRSCGRCAGAAPLAASSSLSVKRHSAITSAPSSTGDLSSAGEDDELSPALAPPNLDRLRQRRATLVAKTIINQMATQPSLTASDEQIRTPIVHIATQRARSSAEPMTKTLKFTVTPAEPATINEKTSNNQSEFLEISKQISSLLAPSDEEN